ncbi:hypothetical protein [Ulvibacterium sp.]|uniref:hypothetical protein n=1 Tax=Ulvibacterium sp. TaxID=2665914 RepID=UPI003CC6DA54
MVNSLIGRYKLPLPIRLKIEKQAPHPFKGGVDSVPPRVEKEDGAGQDSLFPI